jgi:hypothetical protein
MLSTKQVNGIDVRAGKDRDKDWREMKEMMLRTGSVILIDEHDKIPARGSNSRVNGSITESKGTKGTTLNGQGKATDKDVQGECSIRTRAKTE